MSTAGYIRVSTDEQTTDNQKLQIQRAFSGPLSWYEDVISSGKKTRPDLERLKGDIRTGKVNEVYTVALDRIARSTIEALQFAELCNTTGTRLVILNLGIDTGTVMGKFFFTVSGAFAELERELIRERTIAGLKRAKAEGKHIGRPRTPPHVIRSVHYWKGEGMKPQQIAEKLKISRSKVYAILSKKTPPVLSDEDTNA